MDPFLFVVGCERSGTTLLRAMLDSHPDLAVPPESYFLVPLMKETFSPQGFLALVGEHRRFARWDLPIEEVREAFRRAEPGDLAAAVRVLYRTYAAARGKSRWGDKSPGYVRHVKALAGLLPEAHFIHIIRDGRDVALSWLDAPFGPGSITEAAERWRKDVRAGRRSGRKHAAGRYMEVRYEALVEDPEAVLRNICDLAGLPFEPAMLGYTSRADEVISATLEPGSHQRLHQPPTAGLRDWRRDMRPADVASFEKVAGGLLARLDYGATTAGDGDGEV